MPRGARLIFTAVLRRRPESDCCCSSHLCKTFLYLSQENQSILSFAHVNSRGNPTHMITRSALTSFRMASKMIDIGANLTDPMFRGIYNGKQRHRDDFDDMLARSFENGLEKIIITGGSLEDSRAALGLTSHNENLFSTVGCHPTRCGEFDAHKQGPTGYLNELSDLIGNSNSKVVAIGELGLDYDRLHFCPKETQKKYFEMQLNLAKQFRLPLFLHNRNSIDDFIEILERRQKEDPSMLSGVVHSFDGSIGDANRVLKLGLYIGINGCSLKTDDNLEVIKHIPADRLMIETDCPWCEIRKTHAGHKYIRTALEKCKNADDPKLAVKNRNEPMNLIQVLEVISAVRNEDIESLATQIRSNTMNLFFNPK